MAKIALRVSNHQAFVWNIQDLEAVRAKHRICGLLIGTLPHLAQQNVFLGVPLTLMPEEAVLLVEKGFAVFIDELKAYYAPTPQELVNWASIRGEEAKRDVERREELKEDAAMSWKLSDAAIQKRKEREAKRAVAKAAAAEGGEDDALFTPTRNIAPPLESNEDSAESPTFAVTIPTESSDLSWYSPDSHTYETISAAKEAGIWSYPSNLHERAKCGVFRDLWEKGYYLGGGMRFGGDYLVYPGDPLRYHSHFVASVLDSPTSSLLPVEIVAHGRLGTGTKKSHLLCGWNDDTREVSYHSIEWSGFG
ncbi:tRNA-intron endonuclease catalytic domain-like protein [Rickenella mellea]|uniref:tRNA-splicing endonuclease subunit Sen34 n=1 Tax=Rickenella mellea TaxID=50990 RepID=A0A4Y7QK47_9AGAM|nr:tRNA-intron endonuclease catalytic domain-like protein [Rickenella mellea]